VARGAVEKTVERKAGDAVAERTAGAPGATPARRPAHGRRAGRCDGVHRGGAPEDRAFTESVLEITEARIAQLVRGLEAEQAARPAAERAHLARVAAAREADRTYPARRAAYDREAGGVGAPAGRAPGVHRRRAGALPPANEAQRAKFETTANAMNAQMTPERRARMQEMGARARRRTSAATRRRRRRSPTRCAARRTR
jgi:hypothetical protein